MQIVITDRVELSETAIEKLRQLPAKVYDDTPANESEIINRIKDAELITANYIDITPAIIDAAPSLKYIIVPAVGYEWVDYKYAASKGITVLNCPTHNSLAVAEHAIALLFATARKVVEASTAVRDGEWQQDIYKGLELNGKRLGLIGYGNIGKNIRRMAEGLGMQVSYTNSRSTAEELESLLSKSDIVTLCLPLTEATTNLIDAKRLSLMKPTAILINIARGAIIDQEALRNALESHQFAGAGLDVFAGEPLKGKPSDEIIKLSQLSNVVATPYIASNTEETAVRLATELLADIQSCIDGTPINVIN
jgi:phosphoglycerate dehydrogenase-like enzyme